jgi:hypothetical protein
MNIYEKQMNEFIKNMRDPQKNHIYEFKPRYPIRNIRKRLYQDFSDWLKSKDNSFYDKGVWDKRVERMKS